MQSMTDDIRQAVRIELVKRRMTQTGLAEQAGITPQHLSRMMQGDSSNIPGSWEKVFDTLGLEVVVRPKQES
jgi:DNA-binding phage protein